MCETEREKERGEGERQTAKNERQKEKRERQTETERDGQTDKKKSQRQRHRHTERQRHTESDSERERERVREVERARKNMLGTYYSTKYTRRCMERNITPKVSPRLPFISSNHTSHLIKQGHPQHIIKPHFHSASISIVIFHTDHRATGSSSLVVYSKQYRISV